MSRSITEVPGVCPDSLPTSFVASFDPSEVTLIRVALTNIAATLAHLYQLILDIKAEDDAKAAALAAQEPLD